MSDNWDFYFCNVDNKPASIFVDLEIAAPQAERPHMVFLRLYMRTPRDDGLSSQTEFDVLTSIEDTLKSAATANQVSFVGRLTTDGYRDHVFYAPHGGQCEEELASTMRRFQDYRFETGSRPDEDWKVYREFLYPTARQRQTMSNRQVYDRLSSNGDGMAQSREIDHWVYFKDEKTRVTFIDACRKNGFKIRRLTDPTEKSPRYCAQVFRTDTPTAATFDAVVLLLFDLATQTGGEYDGWETPIVS